jgi:hypothetical protein
MLWTWVTCGVKMMWLCHGWGWQKPQTASQIHMRHIHSVWAHRYAVNMHMVAALHSFNHMVQILGVRVTCGVKMMWLCHGWVWHPPQTASHIYIGHIYSVWAHWYAVHRHRPTAALLPIFTHSNSLRFWGSGSLVVVESKWWYCVMVEADSHLKLLNTFI